MITHRHLLLAGGLGLLVCISASARGQTPADSAFAHGPRHVLSLSVGLLPSMKVSTTGVEANGTLGGLSYAFWPTAEWSIEVSAATHSAEAHAWESHAVTSLLFGGNWYPRRLAPAPTLRPYVGLALGPYTASVSRVSDVRTQNVLGARVGGGVDAFPARWFRLGLRAAYHVAADFDTPVDGLRSASGPELSLQLGIAFGRR